MNKLFSLTIFVFLSTTAFSQSHQDLDTVKPKGSYENIYSRPLYHDSLVSSFLIFVKKEVKLHKHASHAEHVYILEGEGEMLLGEQKLKVGPGSIVFIPANSPHSLKVTSKKPMKVISVQAPFFDGKDRIMIPDK